MALTTRIHSPWECAGLDLRFDPELAGPTDLRQAGLDAQQTLHLPDPPHFLWGAGPKRVSATAMVALERGLALGALTPQQEGHLEAEGIAREMIWDRASELYLPVHVYQDVRQRIHDRPMDSFIQDYRHRTFLVGPDGRTPLQEAVDAAIDNHRSWIPVPALPAPKPEPEFVLPGGSPGEWDPDDYNPDLVPRTPPEKAPVEVPGRPQETPEPPPPSLPTPEPPAPEPAKPHRRMRR